MRQINELCPCEWLASNLSVVQLEPPVVNGSILSVVKVDPESEGTNIADHFRRGCGPSNACQCTSAKLINRGCRHRTWCTVSTVLVIRSAITAIRNDDRISVSIRTSCRIERGESCACCGSSSARLKSIDAGAALFPPYLAVALLLPHAGIVTLGL